MDQHQSHLQPDGTTFPPVTPDPPPPPGYVDPLAALQSGTAGDTVAEGTPDATTEDGGHGDDAAGDT